MKRKKIDFWVVVGLLLAGSFTAYFIEARNITHGVLFLGIPSTYLLVREKKNYRKILWGVLLFGVIFGSIFDFFMTFNRVWDVTRLQIPYKLFGVWAVETVAGYSLMTLFVLLFYEHFLDNENHSRLSPRHSKLFIVSLLFLSGVMVIATFNPNLFMVHYAYLWGGVTAIMFPVIFSIFNPKIVNKFLMLAIFFFFVWLLLENVGVRLGGWIYPGKEYIGYVKFFGISFPTEELLFWMIWHPATIVAYYEYFVDDGK